MLTDTKKNMSKKRKRIRHIQQKTSVKRDANVITKRLALFVRSPEFNRLPRRSIFHRKEVLDDKRRFTQRDVDTFLHLDGRAAKIKTGETRQNVPFQTLPAWERPAFENSRTVLVCIRRSRRRQELFRGGYAGKNKRIFGKRRWRPDSEIVCKRRRIK